MLSKRRAVAQQVADRLMPSETAIDRAIIACGELAAFLPAARLEAGVAAEIGHDAIAHSQRASSLLVEARAAMLDAHRALAQAKIDVGLRTVGVGGLMPKADDEMGKLDAANAA